MAPTRPTESGLAPDPAAVPQAGNMQGQAISITVSQPGDSVDESYDPSRLCCQSAAGLEIHNVPIFLPEPVAILILPHTPAAEHARHISCHECARTQPSSRDGVGKSGQGWGRGIREPNPGPFSQHTVPSAPPSKASSSGKMTASSEQQQLNP